MDEDGLYIVSCPTFKGCHTYGATIDEALENIREVVEICLEIRRIEFDRLGRSETEIRQKVEDLFGDLVTVTITEESIIIEGDLHDHRRRKPLLDYLAGEEDGVAV